MLLMIIAVLAALNVLVISVGVLLRQTYFQSRFNQVQPYGSLVDVYDGRMHLHITGSGEHTIVLLPGLGVGLPSADFGPLARTLAERHRVVVLEYFGVGFSSGTNRTRGNAEHMAEIREALRQADLPPPYVLMPHSISGIYSEYYASRHPDEVLAIISLDGTSSAYWQETPAILNAIIPLARLQQASGLTALLGGIITNRSKLRDYGYAEGEISDMITFAGFSVNDTQLRQIQSTSDIVRDIKDLPFPEQVPYLKIIARDTYEKPNRQLTITPQEYQYQHLAKLGPQVQHQILEGNHFIYQNNSGRIAETTAAFLAGLAAGRLML